MRTYLASFCVLLGLIGLMPVNTFAQQSITISVVTTFDYPGVGNSTTPFGINDRGDIAGDYVDANNVQRGFIRFSDGSFSQPFVAPNDTAHVTRGLGINDWRTVTLTFFNTADNIFHGGFLKKGVITQFDLGSFGTSVNGINDFGHFVGTAGSPLQGFLNIGKTSTAISIPGAIATRAIGINNFDWVVGRYAGSNAVEHGYVRKRNGSLTFPIDFPGSTLTTFNGINDRGWMVGNYLDGSGQHGGFLQMPNTFVSFDFPGASSTSLNGINDKGFISGRYTDSAGIRHGFVARVWPAPDDSDDQDDEN